MGGNLGGWKEARGAYKGELVEVGEVAVFASCFDEGVAAPGISPDPVPFFGELLLWCGGSLSAWGGRGAFGANREEPESPEAQGGGVRT